MSSVGLKSFIVQVRVEPPLVRWQPLGRTRTSRSGATPWSFTRMVALAILPFQVAPVRRV